MPAPPPASGDASWRVSRQCDGGACVMVRSERELILVGTTVQYDGPYLIFTKAEWKKFVSAAQRGDFDRSQG